MGSRRLGPWRPIGGGRARVRVAEKALELDDSLDRHTDDSSIIYMYDDLLLRSVMLWLDIFGDSFIVGLILNVFLFFELFYLKNVKLSVWK